jgi:hypothetical protein
MKKSDGIGAMPATAGISLVIGLLASTFGSKSGGGNNALQEATDAFLDNLKQSLEAFEAEVLTIMEKFEQAKASGDDALSGLEDVIYALNQSNAWSGSDIANAAIKDAWMQALQSYLIEGATELQSAIEHRYDLKIDLINDVFDLLEEKADWTASLDKSITDVTRSLYTDEKMFTALQQDMMNAFLAMNGTSGQDAIDAAGALEDAALAFWDIAQEVYSADPTAAQSSYSTAKEDYETAQAAYDAGQAEIEGLRAAIEVLEQAQDAISSTDNEELSDVNAKLPEEYAADIKEKEARISEIDSEGLAEELSAAIAAVNLAQTTAVESNTSYDALLAAQDQVLSMLDVAKVTGEFGDDNLININLELLGVAREGLDLEAQMNSLVEDLNAAMTKTYDLLEQIATAPVGDLGWLLQNLSIALATLGLEVPAMASGGVALGPTLALIDEGAEKEAVVPLDTFWTKLDGRGQNMLGEIKAGLAAAVAALSATIMDIIVAPEAGTAGAGAGSETTTLERITNTVIQTLTAEPGPPTGIPALATGGIATAPTFDLIGKSLGAEAAIPPRSAPGANRDQQRGDRGSARSRGRPCLRHERQRGPGRRELHACVPGLLRGRGGCIGARC